MLRSSLRIACISVLVGASYSALALSLNPANGDDVTTASLAAPSKNLTGPHVALVDVQAVILQTEQGKAARAKIEKDMAPKRQGILNQKEAIKKMGDEFEAQQAILSDADKATKQKDFQTKMQAFQQAQMAFDQELKQKESVALQEIFHNTQIEVQKIAKSRGFDMVFDKSASVLLYSNNASDITNDLVALYNKDFKVGGKTP